MFDKYADCSHISRSQTMLVRALRHVASDPREQAAAIVHGELSE